MIVILNRRCIRAALIDIDEARLPVPINGVGQESPCGLLIALGRE